MASSSAAVVSNPLLGFQISEKLGKQNHALWSAQVLAAIRGARLDDHIRDMIVIPSAEIERKEDDMVTKSPNPAYLEWFARDQQVLGFLFSSLSREVLTQVAASKTASEAWRTIEGIFTSQTRARSLNVRLSLTTTRKGNMTVSEYFGKMKSFGDELAASGKQLDEEELVAYMLNGLDDDFEPVVSALVARVEPITLTDLYSQLLNFENRQALRSGGSSANSVTRGCGGLSSRGGAGRGRNTSRGRGHDGRGRSGSNQQRTDSRPVCQVCYKRGHMASDCWHRFDQNYVPDERHVAAANHTYEVDTNWYLDTGATDHLTGELDKLSVKEKYKGKDQIHAANGQGSSHEEYDS